MPGNGSPPCYISSGFVSCHSQIHTSGAILQLYYWAWQFSTSLNELKTNTVYTTAVESLTRDMLHGVRAWKEFDYGVDFCSCN